VLAKALSKDPTDRFERCADFARALTLQLDGAPTDDVATTLAVAAPRPKRSLLRAGVIVPAILAVLLIGAITVAVTEFHRADRSARSTATAKSPKIITPTFMPSPPPPEPVAPPAATSPAAHAAVIGARCSPVGNAATTANGATVYCSTLRATGASIWSLIPGEVPTPAVSIAPEETLPVRVCMQQTGRTRLQCREEIRRSNLGLP